MYIVWHYFVLFMLYIQHYIDMPINSVEHLQERLMQQSAMQEVQKHLKRWGRPKSGEQLRLKVGCLANRHYFQRNMEQNNLKHI